MADEFFPGREFRGYVKAEEPLYFERTFSDSSISSEDETSETKTEDIKSINNVSSELQKKLRNISEFHKEASFPRKKALSRELYIGVKPKPSFRNRKWKPEKSKRDTNKAELKTHIYKRSPRKTEKSSESTLETLPETEENQSVVDSLDYSETSEEDDSFDDYYSSTSFIPDDFIFPKSSVIKAYRKRSKGPLKWFTKLCPCISKLIFSNRNEYLAAKSMLGFPIGLLFGYILHKLIIERLKLTPFSTRILGMSLCLWMGIGYATSSQVRCICFLTIPSLCGKTGRAYVSTFVLTFIITGPIANIIGNAKESTRVMSCVASLNYNHTVKRFKLMFKPVKEIIWEFVGAGEKIKLGTKGLNSAYKEIEEEVHDDDEVKMAVAETQQLDKELSKESRVDKVKKKFSTVKDAFGSKTESKYGMKAEFRCEGIFTQGIKGCYKSFGAAYDRCHAYLPIVGYLLCWPMKLTFICDIAGAFMGRRACDSKDAMSPGFGESMDTAEGVQKEFDKAFGVQVHYKIKIPDGKWTRSLHRISANH